MHIPVTRSAPRSVPVPAGERVAIAVQGAAAPEGLLNEALRPLGFAPVVMAPSLADATALMRSRQPTLVLAPVDTDDAVLDGFAAELRRHPYTTAIGTARLKDADVVLRAMRAGILEFLVAPITGTELMAAVHRMLDAEPRAQAQGHVVTVFSAKGGLGVSTIAVSLAWALANQDPTAKVSMADFTTTGAGVRVLLNLQPPYDLASIAPRLAQLDADVLQSVLYEHPERVAILAATDAVTGDGVLETAGALRVLDMLRQLHDHVVIDTDHTLGDQTVAALDGADTILLVTHGDIPALRSSQRSLELFARLGYPEDKIAVVLNRYSDRDRISRRDAERVLGRPVTATLPNEYETCADAITAGRFVQRYAAATPFPTAMSRLARTLRGEPSSDTDTARTRFSRLFRRH